MENNNETPKNNQENQEQDSKGIKK